MPTSGAAAPHAAASRVSPVRVKVPDRSARAQASRLNGAKSRGPKTPEGKARSAQNALKHGFCAKKFLLLLDDSRTQFAAWESALLDDLAPEGALQILLAHRLVAAAWRLARADRLEFELFCQHDALEVGPGLALIRDGNGARAFPTLVRYRGAAQAELFRTLKALKALQSEDASNAADDAEVPPPGPILVPQPLSEESAAHPDLCPSLCEMQDEPRRTPAQKCDAHATRNEPERHASGQECDTQAARNEPGSEQTPNGPEVDARPAAVEPGESGEVGAAAGQPTWRAQLREPHPSALSTGSARGTSGECRADPHGDCTPLALR